jgi:hypothetical protein
LRRDPFTNVPNRYHMYAHTGLYYPKCVICIWKKKMSA